MNQTFAKLSVAIFFVASCALSAGASAQSDPKQAEAKHALAVKLAQLQQKAYGAIMTQQLVGSAVQPSLMNWSQRLDQNMPQAQQKEVREKLDVELKKFTDTMQKAIDAQLAKTAEAAMAPIYMDKLTEGEMNTIIAYLESPASAKFQMLDPDTSSAWAQRIVEATRATQESSAKEFDDAADRIVGALAAPPAPAPAAAPASASSAARASAAARAKQKKIN